MRRSIDGFAAAISEKIQEEGERGLGWTEKRVADVQTALARGRDFLSREFDRVGLR
jgi:hypothetical protein